MSKGIFITATGTDIGKTYVTALLIRKMRRIGLNTGYYKAALSGAECIAESDAGYVNKFANIDQDENTLVSYLYKNAVSPHLAAQIEGNPPELSKIKSDYDNVCKKYNYVIVEGSGGIVCPIRWDDSSHLLLEDIIKALDLGAIIVADAGLGTINSVVLTAEYMRNHDIAVHGIILNNFTGTQMQNDNAFMIEELIGISIVGKVGKNADEIDISEDLLKNLFK